MPYLYNQQDSKVRYFGHESDCHCTGMRTSVNGAFGETTQPGKSLEEESKMVASTINEIFKSGRKPGIHDVNKLSDQVFFARYPARDRRLIDPRTEPDLAAEWKHIKARLVLPILDAMDSNDTGKEAMYAELYLPAMRFFDRARRITVSPAELRAKATYNLGAANFQLKRFAAVIGYMEIVRTWKGTSEDLKDLRDKAERLFLKAKEEYSKAVPTT